MLLTTAWGVHHSSSYRVQRCCILCAGDGASQDDGFPWARLDRGLLLAWIMEGRCPPPNDHDAGPDTVYAEVGVPFGPYVLQWLMCHTNSQLPKHLNRGCGTDIISIKILKMQFRLRVSMPVVSMCLQPDVLGPSSL